MRGQSPQTVVRYRRTTRPTKRRHNASDEYERDTDKEIEKASDEAEDTTLYCYCKDVSWGEVRRSSICGVRQGEKRTLTHGDLVCVVYIDDSVRKFRLSEGLGKEYAVSFSCRALC